MNETQPQAWAGNSINTVIFRKNALVTHGDVQFMAYYNPEGYLCLAKRKRNDEQWEIRQTQYTGNIRDAHNSISIMTDGEGYLHVSWNHHGNPLNYARSLSPLSLDLGNKQAMTAVSEENVTYPEFYKLSDGNLIFMYRDGQSGKGNLAMNRYGVQTKQWQRLHENLIDGEGQRNAYWQTCVDAAGTIHLSWVWRETPDVGSNHDMCYARSRDNGQTWENAQGKKYRLPITAATAEYVCRIPQSSELINQTSMTADNAGNPYIATYFREQDSDIPQYYVICQNEDKWQTLNTSFRKTAFSLKGGGTKSIPVSRPQIVVNEAEGEKQIVLIFRDEERGKKVSMAACTDIQGNQWSVGDLTEYGVGEWEPTYDTELWKDKRILQLYVQQVRQTDGEGVSDMPAQQVSVLTVPLVIN
ncbi:MAG: BNR repeat-containing protein [Dysgonamonadaceae bacterium]|nr:BNR repeat-containing protein [Dysgonamonadaceae bacterium]